MATSFTTAQKISNRLSAPLGKIAPDFVSTSRQFSRPKEIKPSPYGLKVEERLPDREAYENGFSGNQLKSLEEIAIRAVLPARVVLFVEQQRPRGLFILRKGRIMLSRNSSRGKCLAASVAEPGQFLGLSAILNNCVYETTAETLSSCQLAFIDAADFRRFLVVHPDAHRVIARHLARQVKSAGEQLAIVGLRSPIERLAEFLLRWSSERGASADATPFFLPLTHQQIAQCLGTTRESVSRALRKLRLRGLIEIDESSIVIPKRRKLTDVVVMGPLPASLR